MTVSDIVAIVTAAGGMITGIVAVYLARSTRQKVDAEAEANQASAAEQVSEAWSRLQAPLKERVEDLEKEVLSLQAREIEKDKRIRALEAQEKEKSQRIEQLETTVETAMRYIKAMERRMDEAGIDPPSPPTELLDWLNNHGGK